MATNNAIDIGVVPGGGFTYTFPSATSTLYGTGTGTITSAQLATSLTDETGSGANVFATSPTLVTPVLGVATATSINGNTFTTGTYTLTGTAGKTLTFTNSLTLSGTDATVMTFPSTTATIARTDAAQTFTGVQTFSSSPVLSTGIVTVGGNAETFPSTAQTLVGRTSTDTLTNKRITKRVLALSANSATPAINTDNFDVVHITAQSVAITSFTSSLTGAPVDGDTLRISVTGTTAIALSFGTSFEGSGGTPLSTTTVTTARLDMGFFWNTETSKWRQVAAS